MSPIFWLLAVGIVGAPLSSKIAGALWLGLCVAGLWLAVRRAPANAPSLQPVTRAWLIASAASLGLAALGTWIWHDKWDELHAGTRLALAALAALPLAGRADGAAWHRGAGHALALSCMAACGLALTTQGDRLFPTNAIPWAAAISFFCCLLLPLMLHASASRPTKIFWALGLMAGLMAVLLSQSRGAYGIVLWVVLCSGAHILVRRSRGDRTPWLMLTSLVIVLGASMTMISPINNRLQLAGAELDAALGDTARTPSMANSSIGSRIVLWKVAIEGFQSSPLIGVGREERIRRIQQAGDALQADQLSALRHVHSEYLNAALDKGLIGLASVLAALGGLIWAAWLLRRIDTQAAWQMAGLAFMHGTAGITNVNTAHNYYGAMLAASALLVLTLARSRPA